MEVVAKAQAKIVNDRVSWMRNWVQECIDTTIKARDKQEWVANAIEGYLGSYKLAHIKGCMPDTAKWIKDQTRFYVTMTNNNALHVLHLGDEAWNLSGSNIVEAGFWDDVVKMFKTKVQLKLLVKTELDMHGYLNEFYEVEQIA